MHYLEWFNTSGDYSHITALSIHKHSLSWFGQVPAAGKLNHFKRTFCLSLQNLLIDSLAANLQISQDIHALNYPLPSLPECLKYRNLLTMKSHPNAANNYATCGMELDVNAVRDLRRLSKTSNGPQDEVKSELCNRFGLAVDWLTDGLTGSWTVEDCGEGGICVDWTGNL